MVIPATAARDELHRRLAAVADEFAELYPGVQEPRVFLGLPANEPPFYIAVDDIVDTARTPDGATMGHAGIEFDLRVWAFARHADRVTASDTLLAYVDAVFAAVLADHTLAMAVDNSRPSVESAGSAPDSSKRYMAAAEIAVTCQVWAACPDGLAEVVRRRDGDEV